MSSMAYAWARCISTVLTVTNNAWAICRLVKALCGDARDTALAGGERVRGARALAPRPSPGGAQLLASTVGEPARAGPRRLAEACAQRRLCVRPATGAPERASEPDARAYAPAGLGRRRAHPPPRPATPRLARVRGPHQRDLPVGRAGSS